MSNLNNRHVYDRNDRREVYRDSQGTTVYRDSQGNPIYRDANTANTTVPPQRPVRTEVNDRRIAYPKSNTTAYRDGYVQGRISEHRLQEEHLRDRDNDNAARGLLIGIVLTSLASLVVGLLFLAQRNQTPVPASSPVVVPSAPANQAPSRETTIIERNNTRVVPVPQQPAAPPEVNITIPDASQQAPVQADPSQTAPTQPSTQSGSQNTGGTVQNGGVTPVIPEAPTGATTGGTTGGNGGSP